MLYILTFAFVILGMYVVFGLLRAAARFLIFAAAVGAFWYVHTRIAAGEVSTAWDAIKTAAMAGAAAGVICSPLLPLLDTGSRQKQPESATPADPPPTDGVTTS